MSFNLTEQKLGFWRALEIVRGSNNNGGFFKREVEKGTNFAYFRGRIPSVDELISRIRRETASEAKPPNVISVFSSPTPNEASSDCSKIFSFAKVLMLLCLSIVFD